jgi:MerR family transcriptional regulator, mercuric resistance operon regulatory protein
MYRIRSDYRFNSIMITKMRLLPIGELAEMTGVNLETVRYYERIGLPRPERTPGGHRNYESEHVRRLSFIRRSRELGFTIDQVRGLLQLVDGRRYTCGEVQAIAFRHIADVRRKIADLRHLEEALANLAARCKGGQVPECPIVDALFAAPSESAADLHRRRSRPR